MSKNDPVKQPAHYEHPSGIEVIQITRHETFLRGNIIKYVLRAPYKGSELQDLEKAAVYLQWEIERVRALEADEEFVMPEIEFAEEEDNEF
jgi:hypothetical protein